MGISLWLILKTKAPRSSVVLFGIQLALNIGWSFFFFYLHRPDLAFLEILILFVFILLTIAAFKRDSTLAAWLLVPYALWVSFASYLNFTIWQLN